MNGPIEQHRLAAFSAFRPVGSASDIDAIPALAELTAKRRFLFGNCCFSHGWLLVAGGRQPLLRKLQKARHTRIVTNSHNPANCNSKPPDWGFTDFSRGV